MFLAFCAKKIQMRKYLLISLAVLLVATTSCSKKSNPSKSDKIIYNSSSSTSSDSKSISEEKPEEVSAPVTKPAPVKKPAPAFPETIYVNDAAARKSVDGRLYYDVEGHRYWKNYKDGKYYLFNKSMYKNPDFKPPKKD